MPGFRSASVLLYKQTGLQNVVTTSPQSHSSSPNTQVSTQIHVIISMLESGQLQELYQFLSKQWGTPREATDYFQTVLCSHQAPFRLEASLNQLLLLNLLSIEQRILTLVILLSKPYQDSEFISTMLFILEQDQGEDRGFERWMVYQCWYKNNLKKFSDARLTQLVQEHEIPPKITQSGEKDIVLLIQKLREIQGNTLPKLAKQQVCAGLEDYDLSQPPGGNLQRRHYQKLGRQKATVQSFRPFMMRPIPEFIPVCPSELVYLSPGIVTDLQYDFSEDLLQLYLTAQARTLSKMQKQWFEQLFVQERERVLANPSEYIEGFTRVFTSNPGLAETILQHLQKEKVAEYFYDKLIDVQLTKGTLEAMKRIASERQLPTMTLHYYIIKTMQKCEQVEDEALQEVLARMIVAVVRGLIKSKRVQTVEIESEIRGFGIKFSHIEEVAKFYKCIVQTNI